ERLESSGIYEWYEDGRKLEDTFEFWGDYSDRVLIPGHHMCGTLARRQHDWCFGGCWEEVDNTPIGAAKRIRFMLKYPDLKGWNGMYTKKALADRLPLLEKKDES
ncbi:hypothetical protein IH799_08925, partial [candidate division KSB1 bacterium]|nr:hypothetical protein [candidate division KSB1 bacterium]